MAQRVRPELRGSSERYHRRHPHKGTDAVQQQIESDVSLPVTNAGGLWQSTYVTGRMAVPLEFNDISPHATYTAGFTADIYGQVSGDPNWANNLYNYPGYFSFLSLESQDREGPFVIERVRKRST